MDAFTITLPIFALVGIGWASARCGLLDSDVGTSLSRFVFWLAFPCLLLTSMAKAPPPSGETAFSIGIWLGVLLGFQIVARLLAKLLGFSGTTQAGMAMAVSVGNTAFLGTSVLAGLLPPHLMAIVAAFVATENIVVTGFGVAGLYLSKPTPDKNAAYRALINGLTNPTSLGACIGFALSVSGIHLGAPLLRPLELLGAAASPAGLIALGIVIATTAKGTQSGWVEIGLTTALKCVALPLAMWVAFSAFGAPHDLKLIATLLAACPSAVNVFIQSRVADVWADRAAVTVVATTLASIITVTFVASLF